MLRKSLAVLTLACGVSLIGCGGDACEELRLLCDDCTDLVVRTSCHSAREAALLLPVGASDACQASLNSNDWDSCLGD